MSFNYKLLSQTTPISTAKPIETQSAVNSSNESGNKPPINSDTTISNYSELTLNIGDRHYLSGDSLQNSATILIVDDTPNNLQVLFSCLETAGFRVLLAEDGASALQIAQSQTPDLILLDVLMPDLDGFETCIRLKSQRQTKEIPVIFLTALSETVNRVQGFKLGGVDYITKPIEQEEVLARIQTHLNLQRMRRVLSIQNRELRQTIDFEASVRRITDRIRDSLNETSCLQIATKELATVLNLGSCQVELYDLEQTTATIVHEYSITLPACRGETRQINDFPELYQQLLQKSPLQLVEAIPQFNPSGIQVSRLACPIFDDRGIIGNLWGLRPPGEVFTPLEIGLIQQVASQCAIAIRQARLYADSNRQVAELAKLNQLKNDFLKTISHELKTPMSSIQLAAQTLENLLKNTKNPRKSPLFERVFNIFHDSCQRQKDIIDNLVTLCQADARVKAIQPEKLELNAWLKDLTQPYINQIKNKQQKLVLDLTSEKIDLIVDPVILERVVKELLDRAERHTPLKGTIMIKTEITKSTTSLQIINSNPEISTGEQKLISTQVSQIAIDSISEHDNTALGLTLVKKLVEILGATIDLTSDPGQTVFSLNFPIKSLD